MDAYQDLHHQSKCADARDRQAGGRGKYLRQHGLSGLGIQVFHATRLPAGCLSSDSTTDAVLAVQACAQRVRGLFPAGTAGSAAIAPIQAEL